MVEVASSGVDPIPVMWWPEGAVAGDGRGGKGGCWDHSIIMRLLDGAYGTPPGWPGMVDVASTAMAAEIGTGAIVVVSGRFHGDDIPALKDDLDLLGWVVLIVTSDEEHVFPLREVVHPNMQVWRQLPQVDHPDFELVDRGFGEGPPPGTVFPDGVDRDLSWSFAGQITHPRRDVWWQLLSERQKRLRNPRSVRFDDQGRMYIPDFGAFRVQVYQKDVIPLEPGQIDAPMRAPTLFTA